MCTWICYDKWDGQESILLESTSEMPILELVIESLNRSLARCPRSLHSTAKWRR